MMVLGDREGDNMNRITPIDMSDPLVLIEGNMRFSAQDSHTNTTTYTGSTAIGCQIAYRNAINADDTKKITYRLNLGICYGGGSRPTRERFWYRVGVMRDIPTSFLSGETSQDFGYLAVNEYTDANTDYGEEELDLSNVTGTVYLALMCHGWTSEIDDIECLMRIKAQGDIRAIGDWFRSTRYLKEEINEFFILQNTYTPYLLTFYNFAPNKEIQIIGQTSNRSYTFKTDNVEGSYTGLFFFDRGEVISIYDGSTMLLAYTLSAQVDYISVTSAGITFIDSYQYPSGGGSKQYTIPSDGLYILIFSTGANNAAVNPSHEFSLTPSRSYMMRDLRPNQYPVVVNTQDGYYVFSASANDKVNIKINRVEHPQYTWNTSFSSLYKLSGIRLSRESDIIFHLTEDGSNGARPMTYTPPQDDNYYLEIGLCVGNEYWGARENRTDLTDKSPEAYQSNNIGNRAISALYYGQGNKLPMISMYGRDAGWGTVGCIKL